MNSLTAREFLGLVGSKMGTIVLFGLIISLISFYAFIFTEKRYETSTDYLIVQDQMGTQDFYSLSKSAEYLGGILSEAVYSSVFVNELKKTNKINETYFPQDERESLKQWKKAVRIERSPSLGIMKIRVYDNDKKTAIGISEAITEIMTTKNYLFRGKVNLDVRVLSGPITEKNPSMGKILAVVLGGFILGCGLKLMHIYYIFLKIMTRKERDEDYLRSLMKIK